MISDLYAEDALAAVNDAVRNPRKLPPAPRKTSVWQDIGNFATAIPRAVSEAAVRTAAVASDYADAFGQVGGAYPEIMGVAPTAKQRQEGDQARARLLGDGVDMSSATGDTLREFGRAYRPDAETAHWSEQVLYGFARSATQLVAGAATMGPAGAMGAGLVEADAQAADLKEQGVGLGARTLAGGVQGAGLALAALPLVGSTMSQTAALYLVGGPGGFVAQQALTRKILQDAGHEKIGAQFDPFDPVGLAVASLVPAGFAAYGLRAQKLRRAADSLPANLRDVPGYRDAPPAAETAPPAPFPGQRTATSLAARDYTPGIPDDVVDAAMVTHLVRTRQAANPVADAADVRAAYAHEAALARAEDQIAAGERVSVADVAPAAPAPLIDTRGTGLRFHGTSREIASLADDYAMVGDSRNIYGAGFYTTDAIDAAAGYMKKGKGDSPSLYSVSESPQVKLFNMDAPLDDDMRSVLRSVVGDADYQGADSLIDGAKSLRGWFDEFRAESQNFGLSRDSVQEVWDSVRTNLEERGFRGYEHTGGDKSKTKPHAVRIYWFPEADISIKPSSLDEFRGDPITTFAQNLREVARAVDQELAAADAVAREAAPVADATQARANDAEFMRLADETAAPDAPIKPEMPIDTAATERLIVTLRKRESVLNKLLECMA